MTFSFSGIPLASGITGLLFSNEYIISLIMLNVGMVLLILMDIDWEKRKK